MEDAGLARLRRKRANWKVAVSRRNSAREIIRTPALAFRCLLTYLSTQSESLSVYLPLFLPRSHTINGALGIIATFYSLTYYGIRQLAFYIIKLFNYPVSCYR